MIVSNELHETAHPENDEEKEGTSNQLKNEQNLEYIE